MTCRVPYISEVGVRSRLRSPDDGTMVWLGCVAGKEGMKMVVAKLKCKVCSEFIDNIGGRKHFSEKPIRYKSAMSVTSIHRLLA